MRWAVHSETLHSIRLSQFENITAAPPATAHSHTDKAGKQRMKSSILSNPDELTVRQAAIFFLCTYCTCRYKLVSAAVSLR